MGVRVGARLCMLTASSVRKELSIVNVASQCDVRLPSTCRASSKARLQ